MATDSKTISALVTGASTGIGRELALGLLAGGHQVFASVRKEADGDELRAAGAHVLTFDVTDGPAILSSLQPVRDRLATDRTFSIVNNAGIAVAGPLEDLPIEDLQRQFEVNVFGVMRVTKTFLPLVRETGGRIVNMSSVAGRVTSPFLGAYAASKHALEALSDALRRELCAEGIKVCLIEPGPIQTPIWDKGFGADRSHVSPRYEEALDKFEAMVKETAASALPPSEVLKAVEHALLASSPPVRQLITSRQNRLGFEVSRRLPAGWVDRLIQKRLFGERLR